MQYKKIYLEITNTCNLNCSFCIGNKRTKKVMTFSEFQQILEKIKDYTKYLYFHILGEPLIHPEINKFIDYAKEKDFYVNITTNGYFIKNIEDNKNIRQINISLHSFQESNIDLETYLKNIFETTAKLITNKTYISFRLWIKGQHHKQIIDAINKYYKQNIPYEVENYKINEYLFINNFHKFIWPDLNNDYYEELGTCYALKDHIGILVDGTIVPCCLDSQGMIALGNIFNNNIKDVISTNRYQDMLKGFQKHQKCEELCKHCMFLEEK